MEGAKYPYGYEAHEVLSQGFDSEAENPEGKSNSKLIYPDMKETYSFSLNEGLNGEFPTRFPNEKWFQEKFNTSECDSDSTFETCARAYYNECFVLASKILEIFALALDLDRHWFKDKVNNHQSACRMLNYPHQEKYLPGRTRASQHSDYGIITILKQDDVGGL